jgi:hypothetical protein
MSPSLGWQLLRLGTGNHRVQKFDSFRSSCDVGASGTRRGNSTARGIAVSPGGIVYVADTGNHRIQQFTADGVFVKAWGGLGSRGGDFKKPFDIAFESATTIWVLDAGNDRLEKFEFDRNDEGERSPLPQFKAEIGRSFAPRGSTFTDLASIAWTEERFGYLYVLGAACLVQQFQLDGTLVASWPRWRRSRAVRAGKSGSTEERLCTSLIPGTVCSCGSP